MPYDFIHVNQQVFRKVVDCFSRPGLISSLNEEVRSVDLSEGKCFPSTVLLARMLLDTEVTFKIESTGTKELERRFNQLTYAKSVETSEADYIFLLNLLPHEQIVEAFKQAKIGSLTDPQDSATLFIEVDEISAGDQLRLTGPGIKTATNVSISLIGDWLELRNEKNIEFPMGIDLIFVDKNHNLLCLPRTTRIERMGGEHPWAMSQ